MVGVSNLVPPSHKRLRRHLRLCRVISSSFFPKSFSNSAIVFILGSFFSGPGRFSQTGPCQNFENRVERVYYRAGKQFESKKTVNQWFIEEMLLLSIFSVSYFSCLFICHIRSVFTVKPGQAFPSLTN